VRGFKPTSQRQNSLKGGVRVNVIIKAAFELAGAFELHEVIDSDGIMMPGIIIIDPTHLRALLARSKP
jgi:hypothetical protein